MAERPVLPLETRAAIERDLERILSIRSGLFPHLFGIVPGGAERLRLSAGPVRRKPATSQKELRDYACMLFMLEAQYYPRHARDKSELHSWETALALCIEDEVIDETNRTSLFVRDCPELERRHAVAEALKELRDKRGPETRQSDGTAGDPARFGGHATKGIVEGAMRDFLSELCDQFDQEEQARIRAAEASTTAILAQGTAAADGRRRVAESLHDSYWLFQPENDARIDSAGVVFVAYVNSLWRKTDAARAECIHDFLAKVEELIEPILTKYGCEGKELIAQLRAECTINAWHVHSMLPPSPANTTSSTEDSGPSSPQDGADHGQLGHSEATDPTEQSETEKGRSGNAGRPVILVQPLAILEFSDSWRERMRRIEDLNARYARRLSTNGPEFERQEDLLKDARVWAKEELRKAASELRDALELKEQVVKLAWDKFVPTHRYHSDFKLGYREFMSALWQEGWPSLEDCALEAVIERAHSAPGFSNKLGTTEVIKAPAPAPTASGTDKSQVSTGQDELAAPIQWLVAWRQQQRDVAVQRAWDRMGRQPGWEKAQLQLIQADEDRGQSISSGSASPWQVGVRYYKALAEAWLSLVTDTQSTQDFYTLLPVIIEGVYRQCLEGATLESFRPPSDGARQFQTDLTTLDRDFRKRAAEQAITGGKTPTSTLDGGPAPGADTAATSEEAISGRAARRRAVVDPILKRKRWKIGRLVTDSGVGKATVYGYMDGTRAWISEENRDAICQSLGLELGKLPE